MTKKEIESKTFNCNTDYPGYHEMLDVMKDIVFTLGYSLVDIEIGGNVAYKLKSLEKETVK